MKKRIAVALASASLGALGAGAVAATEGHAANRSTATAAANEEGSSGSEASQECGDRRHRGRRAAIRRATLRVAADAIGIEARGLREELTNGASISEIAEANDVDPADVATALLDAAETRINRAVERGSIDAEAASELLERAADRIARLLTTTHHAADSV